MKLIRWLERQFYQNIYNEAIKINILNIWNTVWPILVAIVVFGLIVFIRHANGLVSTYSGFSVIYVRKDQEVYPGDVIGKSGDIAQGQSPGILYSLQEGDKALAFDMKMHKFYK